MKKETMNALIETLIVLSGEKSVIVVRKPFVEFAGSLEAGMMLSQLLYWTPRSSIPDGWIAKDDASFAEELFCTIYGLRKARQALEGMGLAETTVRKFGGTPMVHYRINLDGLCETWTAWLQRRAPITPDSALPKSDSLPAQSPLSAGAESSSEITTETTTNTPAQAQELQSPIPPAPVSPSEQDKDNGPVQDEIPNALRAFFPEGGVTSARQTTPRTAEEHAQSVATASARGHARRALQQVLADLEARGLLQRHYRDGKSTIYDFSGFSELMRQTKQLGGASKCTMHANAPLVSESDDKGVHPAAHEEEQVNCKQEKEEETHEQELLPEDKAFIDELEEQARNAPPRKSVGAEQRIIDTRQASARGHARRAASNNNITGLPSFEAALKRYGDNAPALRSLQHQIDINFGLMPDWTNKKQVKSWVSGLQEVWIASHEDQDVIIEAGKYLREKAFPIADPRSLTKMARSIAAERATARGSPEVQARKEYR